MAKKKKRRFEDREEEEKKRKKKTKEEKEEECSRDRNCAVVFGGVQQRQSREDQKKLNLKDDAVYRQTGDRED